MNKSAQISLRPGFHSLEHIFRSRIAGYYASSIFKCLRHHHALFAMVAVPFYIRASSAQGFPLLPSLISAYYFLFCFIVANIMGVMWVNIFF